jgi:hypothetical protein
LRPPAPLLLPADLRSAFDRGAAQRQWTAVRDRPDHNRIRSRARAFAAGGRRVGCLPSAGAGFRATHAESKIADYRQKAQAAPLGTRHSQVVAFGRLGAPPAARDGKAPAIATGHHEPLTSEDQSRHRPAGTGRSRQVDRMADVGAVEIRRTMPWRSSPCR